MVLQGKDNSTAFCLLSYSSKRPLADVIRHSPGTRSYYSIVLWVPVATLDNSVYDSSSQMHLPNLPQVAQRTYKRYNVRIILHFSFSLNPVQEEVP